MYICMQCMYVYIYMIRTALAPAVIMIVTSQRWSRIILGAMEEDQLLCVQRNWKTSRHLLLTFKELSDRHPVLDQGSVYLLNQTCAFSSDYYQRRRFRSGGDFNCRCVHLVVNLCMYMCILLILLEFIKNQTFSSEPSTR